jgi:hypothetical protein
VRIIVASILALLYASPSVADCYCHGCGCKGGPGWRVLVTGHCASWKGFKRDCGDPPNNKLCECEGAEQKCPSESSAPIPAHKTGCTVEN